MSNLKRQMICLLSLFKNLFDHCSVNPLPIKHHPANLSHVTNVLKRIAFDENEVSQLTNLYAAETIGYTEEARVFHCASHDYLHWR